MIFDAKATTQQNGAAVLAQNHDAYNWLSNAAPFTLYPNWNTYVIQIYASSTDALGKLTLSIGTKQGDAWIDNVRFFRYTYTKILTPFLSFREIYDDPDRGDTASAYWMQVHDNTGSDIWDTGKTPITPQLPEGYRSIPVVYDGTIPGHTLELDSGKKYTLRVKLWDNSDNEGAWTNNKDYFTMRGNRVQDIMYFYDSVSNIREIKDTSTTKLAKDVRYTYDDLNRLTGAITQSTAGDSFYNQYYTERQYAENYAYDPLGSMTSKTGAGSITYNNTGYANPHAPTSIGGVSLTYDNSGNPISYGSNTYTWDYKSRLTSTTNGSSISSYEYDFQDKRIATNDNGIITQYPNDLYNVSGPLITKHVFLNGVMLGTVTGERNKGKLYYDHTDHLTGASVTSDIYAKVAELTDYYPYGGLRTSEHYFGYNEQRKYIGEQYDTATSLSYLDARYYDSSRGQFLSEDPMFWEVGQSENGKQALINPQALNSYAYAGGNPITNRDPNGKCFWDICIAETVIGITIGVGIISTFLYAARDLNSGRHVSKGYYERALPNFKLPDPDKFEPPKGPGWRTIGAIAVASVIAAQEFLEPFRKEEEFAENWSKKIGNESNKTDNSTYFSNSPGGQSSSSSNGFNPANPIPGYSFSQQQSQYLQGQFNTYQAVYGTDAATQYIQRTAGSVKNGTASTW